jgi:uncharacterized protein YkwD
MNRLFSFRLWNVAVLLGALLAGVSPAHPDALTAVQVLREGGCGGVVPASRPLRRDVGLDQSAAQWADGGSLPAAVESHGFRPEFTTGLHLDAPEESLLAALKRTDCRTVTDRTLRAVGVYHRGTESWLVLAYADLPPGSARPKAPLNGDPQPVPAPRPAASAVNGSQLAVRALQLVNDVRARGMRCGSRAFAPAPPMTLSGALGGVAFDHAADMARHNYFEHQDLSGHSPADRVRAIGYPEKLVGENIAYGPQSVEEVVRGWLGSAGHCENIMDPRFAQMGIAYAAGQVQRKGLYWVQVLAEPKS